MPGEVSDGEHDASNSTASHGVRVKAALAAPRPQGPGLWVVFSVNPLRTLPLSGRGPSPSGKSLCTRVSPGGYKKGSRVFVAGQNCVNSKVIKPPELTNIPDRGSDDVQKLQFRQLGQHVNIGNLGTHKV